MSEPIGFRRADTVEEACALLQDRDARLVSGGTALAILIRQGLVRPELLVGVSCIPGFREITSDGTLRLGAAVPLRAAEQNPLVRTGWPLLAETLRHVATARIRNMATIGGGLAHADPAQDPPATYVALGAQVLIAGRKGEHRIAGAAFFTDYYETALQEGEMVVGLEIPPLEAGAGGAFLKFTPRSVDDYATVSAAAMVQLDDAGICREARLALGAAGPTPVTVNVTAALVGERMTEDSARAAAELARGSVDPMDDVRGSAAYKRDMAVVFGRRALLTARDDALRRAGIGDRGG